MPRRREVPKREVLPDPKFGSSDVSKFINVLMTSGKKSVAERIMYGALEQIGKKTGKVSSKRGFAFSTFGRDNGKYCHFAHPKQWFGCMR